MRRLVSRALPLALVLASLAPAHAQPGRGWSEWLEPRRRLALAYRQDGLVHLLRGMGRELELDPALGAPPRWLLLDQALIRFERARRLTPDDPELAYYTAVALTRYERPAADGSTEQRIEEAVEAWHRLRALDPSFFADRVAYELAMLHMRRHEFPQALAEYEAALRSSMPPTLELLDRYFLAAPTERRLAALFAPLDPGNVRGNLAEAAMLTGDVAGALEHYRAAMDGASDPVTRSLAQWGSALALARGGAHEEALRTATRALRDDPVRAVPDWTQVSRDHGAFAVLHLEFVFFEPAYELHAYEALGHEALARLETGGNELEHLRRAVRSWRFFFAEGGFASRHAPSARAALERLERGLEPPAPPVNPRGARSPRR